MLRPSGRRRQNHLRGQPRGRMVRATGDERTSDGYGRHISLIRSRSTLPWPTYCSWSGCVTIPLRVGRRLTIRHDRAYCFRLAGDVGMPCTSGAGTGIDLGRSGDFPAILDPDDRAHDRQHRPGCVSGIALQTARCAVGPHVECRSTTVVKSPLRVRLPLSALASMI
jgi:hypothetical protein